MTNTVIETVTFKLAEGVEDGAFEATFPALEAFTESQKGFIARRFSKGEDGTWLDHIEWSSLQDAQAASENFMQTESIKPFMQCVDGSSVQMSHNQLIVSMG